MNKYYTFAVILLFLTIAGCGQKQLPPPYPQSPDPAEPVATDESAGRPYQDEDASQLKQSPEPMTSPDLADAEFGLMDSDPKFKPLSAGFARLAPS